jgi:hypothetical protein
VQPFRFSFIYRAGARAVLRQARYSAIAGRIDKVKTYVKAMRVATPPLMVQHRYPGTKLDVRVTDSRNREVDHRVADANRWSSIDWTWHVPADAALGYYTITINADPAAARHRPVNYNYDSREIVRGSFLVAARGPDSASTPR